MAAPSGASSFVSSADDDDNNIGSVKFEKVATLLEWIKAYRKKARKTSKKAMARKYLDRFFAAHYPQFFTSERTGMFPLYRLLAPQVGWPLAPPVSRALGGERTHVALARHA